MSGILFLLSACDVFQSFSSFLLCMAAWLQYICKYHLLISACQPVLRILRFTASASACHQMYHSFSPNSLYLRCISEMYSSVHTLLPQDPAPKICHSSSSLTQAHYLHAMVHPMCNSFRIFCIPGSFETCDTIIASLTHSQILTAASAATAEINPSTTIGIRYTAPPR